MVLTEYSEKKKKEGKDSIETIMSLIEFPLLDQTSSNSVISTTPNDLSNWSRLSCLWPLLFYMVPVVVSLNLLQACDSTLIIMDWYQEDQVLGKRT